MDFVSDLATIDILYLNNGNQLRNEIQVLIDNKIKDIGEYQVTRVLKNLKEKGTKFVIRPYVSIGDNSKISKSRIQNSIIQNDNKIKNANLANSMLSNFVTFEGKAIDISVGDYKTISQF